MKEKQPIYFKTTFAIVLQRYATSWK